MKEINLTNHRYGMLIVVNKTNRASMGRPLWSCICDCGNIGEWRSNALRSGNTKSCGCWKISSPILRSRGLKKDPLYSVWYGMKQRCHYPKAIKYKNYGCRGISVCSEWIDNSETFIKWGHENGYRLGLDLDRKNNNLGYSPDNCHFVTHKENCQNRGY